MKIFECQHCAHPVYFENTYCQSCGHLLGYVPDQFALVTLKSGIGKWHSVTNPSEEYNYCGNHKHGVCNWLIPFHSNFTLCEACRLNQTIPDLKYEPNIKAWRDLENAKHRLIYSLHRFGLPLNNKLDRPVDGLAFSFLADDHSGVVKTGHFIGLITINLGEADPVRREFLRAQMSEPYRTLIGHFRHEVGHYYWEKMVQPYWNRLEGFRNHFGDERMNYGMALQRQYNQGSPQNWNQNYVSEYAASHPWEDWAETWAHYLHLVDTLETAYSFGLSLYPNLSKADSMKMKANFDPYLQTDFDAIIKACIPLTFAVNGLNRSMGQPDLYPFVLHPPVVKKLRFIHDLLHE